MLSYILLMSVYAQAAQSANIQGVLNSARTAPCCQTQEGGAGAACCKECERCVDCAQCAGGKACCVSANSAECTKAKSGGCCAEGCCPQGCCGSKASNRS